MYVARIFGRMRLTVLGLAFSALIGPNPTALKGQPAGIPDASFSNGPGGIIAGLHLKLYSDETFALGCQSCTGEDWCYGRANVADGRLVLTYEKTANGRPTPPEQLVPVTWGRRAYLVFESQMIDFCNDVNSGYEPRSTESGMALLRRGDWNRLAKGIPKLPRPWDDFVLAKPIAGTITKTEPVPENEKAAAKQAKRFISDWQATVNLGTDDGVFKGMRLFVGRQGVYVLSVDKSQCVVRPCSSKTTVSIGDKVSSHP